MEYSSPEIRVVMISAHGIICVSPGNNTEPLHENIFDW